MDAAAFWAHVDSILRERGMTLRDFASRCGLKYDSVLHQRARRQAPAKMDDYLSISEALGVSLDSLLGVARPALGGGMAEAVRAMEEDPTLLDLVLAIIRHQHDNQRRGERA